MTDVHIAPCSPATAYLPVTPVKVPQPVVDYGRFLVETPVIALEGLTSNGRALQSPMPKQSRTRFQVGTTNRWRLPQSLVSDLLGIAQATRAAQRHFLPFNQSYIKVCTAEGRHYDLNKDVMEEGRRPSERRNAKMSASYAASSEQSQPVYGMRFSKSAPGSVRRAGDFLSPLNTFIPSRARPATPRDVFLYHSSQKSAACGPPDVLLHCLGLDWELHSVVLQRATILAKLLADSTMDKVSTEYHKTSATDTLDQLVEATGIYSNSKGYIAEPIERDERGAKPQLQLQAGSRVKQGIMIVLTLDVKDSAVKQEALAIALGNLYHSEPQLEEAELAQVLNAAAVLGFYDLEDHCGKRMCRCLHYSNVSSFYLAALKSGQKMLQESCTRWLELNLVPVMMNAIQLRDIPMSLLEAILKSHRLFTFTEYHLFLCASTWLFLRLNPHIQLMPTQTTVVSYFNSLPKQSSFLERDGQIYQSIFDSLRLHGITDTSQFHSIRLMNILPQDSLVALLAEHYNSLQSGGDMALMRSFTSCAVRQGYIIEKELPYHCEIMSLYGFHFELKTIKTDMSFTFYMQRLKPTDPQLSFRQCERQTFSLRPDRDVNYCIAVQMYNNGEQTIFSSGVVTQRFGLAGKQSRSKALTLKELSPPFYVTFAVLFPPS